MNHEGRACRLCAPRSEAFREGGQEEYRDGKKPRVVRYIFYDDISIAIKHALCGVCISDKTV